MKKLGELLKIQNGFAFKAELFNKEGKGLPIVRIRDLAKGFSETFYDGEYDRVFEVENGDLLIGMDGEFRCYRWAGGKALLNQRVCRLQHFSAELSAGYVFYGINAHLRMIEDSTSFVTVKHLSSKQIADIGMPLPPVAEQERVVKLLDEADKLRKLRDQADLRTAALVPAIYHEMFGDPNHTWQSFVLGELVQDFRYGTSNKSTGQGKPTLRIPNVVGETVNLDGLKFVPVSNSEFERLRLNDGDLLFVRTNGNADYVGRCAVFDAQAVSSAGHDAGEFIYASYLIRARLQTGRVMPLFVQNFLASSDGRRALRARSKTSAGQFNINTEGLGSIPIPVPPVALQKEFAARVTEIRAVQAMQAGRRCRTEDFFQSMLHRAFNEELNTTNDVLVLIKRPTSTKDPLTSLRSKSWLTPLTVSAKTSKTPFKDDAAIVCLLVKELIRNQRPTDEFTVQKHGYAAKDMWRLPVNSEFGRKVAGPWSQQLRDKAIFAAIRMNWLVWKGNQLMPGRSFQKGLDSAATLLGSDASKATEVVSDLKKFGSQGLERWTTVLMAARDIQKTGASITCDAIQVEIDKWPKKRTKTIFSEESVNKTIDALVRHGWLPKLRRSSCW